MTISVCMIVKNEELTLNRILSQAKQFADEIIIVDTGSTDKTVSIAKSFTDKVYSFVWQNDFSLARNYSLSKATCDYFMWLDADDYISQNNIKKIINLKNSNQNADIFMFKYAMGFNQDNQPTFEYYRERLIKNHKEYKFVGFVHEAIELRGIIKNEDIVIEHRKEKTPELKRNLKLFNNAKNNGVKFSAREQYYYARELFYNGYISSCVKALKKYFTYQIKLEANEIDAYVLLSDCYILKNDWDLAKRTMLKCVEKFEPNPSVCCQLGKIYDKKKNFDLAIWWFKNALTSEFSGASFNNLNHKTLVPLIELVKLCYMQGDIQKSVEYHKRAYELFPKNASVVFNQEFFVRKGLV